MSRESSRREFLSGPRPGPTRAESEGPRQAPQSGTTVRLTTRAMACEFAAILNPGKPADVDAASSALDHVHQLEELMTVYRADGQLALVNARAADQAVAIDPRLFAVLRLALDLAQSTGGCFDPTTAPLIELWRTCRQDGRIPSEDEVAAALRLTGVQEITLNPSDRTVRFGHPGLRLNLGAVGKGFALDAAGAELTSSGTTDFLLHGGRSSILARGDHNQQGGWPVGLGNPLFTNQRLGTIVLRNEALATSGSNIQYFRAGGRRFGHILDPRTGWPAEGLLSVSVLAPTAAEADALSTAFFAGGVEIARTYCDNHPEVSAILIPFPSTGRRVEPVLVNVSPVRIFWSGDQVVPPDPARPTRPAP